MNVKSARLSLGFTLVRLRDLSGPRATVYTVRFDDQTETEFDRFLNDPALLRAPDLDGFIQQLADAPGRHGFTDALFTSHEKYPAPLEAMRYRGGQIRLYCCRYGPSLIILGHGGLKPPTARTLQQVPVLHAAFERMTYVADRIAERFRDQSLRLGEFEFEGDPRFDP